MDLCHAFADFASNARYEDLPPSAVEGAKKSLLDTVGVILAASGMEPSVKAVIDHVEESGGRPESSVLAFGLRVPAVMAAFANGAMAHCLDYDDQTPWGQHSASSLIPAVLAASERVGNVSGKDMIVAIAVGQDLFNRLRRYVDWQKNWMFTTVVGVYCAAAAAARILGLPRDRIRHALGIAAMQSSGMAEVVNSTGSDLRAIYAGFPAKGAVLSAILAEKGLSGVPSLFEGKFGVMQLYFGGKYDRIKILEGLGSDYTGGLTLYKRWPAVGTAHSHVHATIELIKEHRLSAGDIAEIRLFVGDYHRLTCEPLETRRAPQTLVDAKFSLPFLVAVAATRGDVRLADFNGAALRAPEVLTTARKVVPVDDATFDWKLELPPGRVEIVTNDGRILVRVGEGVPGSAEAPMTWSELLAKFDDCAAAAIAPLPPEKIERFQRMVQALETLDDTAALLRELT